MAYSTTNPPNNIAQGNAGPSVWHYASADAHGAVDGAGYFTNGDDLGMKVNDVVMVVDTATPSATIHRVSAVTAGGAATVGAATLA